MEQEIANKIIRMINESSTLKVCNGFNQTDYYLDKNLRIKRWDGHLLIATFNGEEIYRASSLSTESNFTSEIKDALWDKDRKLKEDAKKRFLED